MPHPSRTGAAGRAGVLLAAALDRAGRWAAWLVLPLALMLFAQWPLRDGLGAGSRQVNDIGQWLFALYVAFALRETTRRGAHLAAGWGSTMARSRWRRGVDRCGEAVLVLPWALFVLATGAAPTWRSVGGLEAFPDTFDPLYFVIRVAAWLLALLLALQCVLGLIGAGGSAATEPPP